MKKYLLLLVLFVSANASAQDNYVRLYDDLNPPHRDSTGANKNALKNILREIRLQAYVQMEWQRGDTTGKVPYGATGSKIS